jgi:hypothetical protein
MFRVEIELTMGSVLELIGSDFDGSLVRSSWPRFTGRLRDAFLARNLAVILVSFANTLLTMTLGASNLSSAACDKNFSIMFIKPTSEST